MIFKLQIGLWNPRLLNARCMLVGALKGNRNGHFKVMQITLVLEGLQ